MCILNSQSWTVELLNMNHSNVWMLHKAHAAIKSNFQTIDAKQTILASRFFLMYTNSPYADLCASTQLSGRRWTASLCVLFVFLLLFLLLFSVFWGALRNSMHIWMISWCCKTVRAWCEHKYTQLRAPPPLWWCMSCYGAANNYTIFTELNGYRLSKTCRSLEAVDSTNLTHDWPWYNPRWYNPNASTGQKNRKLMLYRAARSKAQCILSCRTAAAGPGLRN